MDCTSIDNTIKGLFNELVNKYNANPDIIAKNIDLITDYACIQSMVHKRNVPLMYRIASLAYLKEDKLCYEQKLVNKEYKLNPVEIHEFYRIYFKSCTQKKLGGKDGSNKTV